MLLLLLIVEPPNGEQLALGPLLFLPLLPIVPIIIILPILLILPDHPLHNFHASLEAGRIPSPLILGLFLLLHMMSILLLLVLFLLMFEFFNVGVPNVPLGYLPAEVVGYRRAGSRASLFYVGVDGLHLAALVVEFVAHCLLDGLYVLA